MPKKVLLSLGDFSADRIMGEILPLLKGEYRFFGIGGRYSSPFLEGKLADVEDIAATGIAEVIPKLPRIFSAKRRIESFIKRAKPDVLIAVDAPGFNLPLIKRAKQLGVKKVIYYILPQVWAWKPQRRLTLARYADSLISILPFEERYFADLGVDFAYAGHPSVEFTKGVPERRPLKVDYFAVFPGSRKNEIKRHLEVLLEAVPKAAVEFKLQPVLLTFKSHKGLLRELRPMCKVVYIDNNPARGFHHIKHARFAWIKSGTTALETALLGTPHLVFYRLSRLSYWLARRWVRVRHIHLANLILGERVVPELVQDHFNPKRLLKHTYRILEKEDLLRERFSQLLEVLKPPVENLSVFEYTARLLQERMER